MCPFYCGGGVQTIGSRNQENPWNRWERRPPYEISCRDRQVTYGLPVRDESTSRVYGWKYIGKDAGLVCALGAGDQTMYGVSDWGIV